MQDDEARALVARIRKVNPNADITSIFLGPSGSSTPPLTARNPGGSAGRSRQSPSATDMALLGPTATPTGQHSARDVAPHDTTTTSTAATAEVVIGELTVAAESSTGRQSPRAEMALAPQQEPRIRRGGGVGDARVTGEVFITAGGWQGAGKGSAKNNGGGVCDGVGGGGGDDGDGPEV